MAAVRSRARSRPPATRSRPEGGARTQACARVPEEPSVCHALRPAAMWVGAHRSHAVLLRWMYGTSASAGGRAARGRPAVPAGWCGALLSGPIAGAIMRHGTANARICPAPAHVVRERPCPGRHPERFSEPRLEPMNPPVTPTREGYGAPQRGEVLSPELALVDPELAAYARANLAEPRVALPKSGRSLWTQVDEDGSGRSQRRPAQPSRWTRDLPRAFKTVARGASSSAWLL